MSNYYDYREVKVMIAHKLMSMEGWKVYGYKEDRSDSMTDYYDPANWGGVAEKNGYVLCVGVYGAAQPEEIRKYNYSGFTYDNSIAEKIKKLEAMTVEHGASEAEEASAKMMIERLQKKAEEVAENANKYIVIGTIPGHMAHPPKMNWHIEKDGTIIAKGNGILKYAHIWKYYSYDRDMEWLNEYKKNKKAYADTHTQDLLRCGYYDSEEDARKNTERHIEDLEEDIKLIDKFEAFINKIDTIEKQKLLQVIDNYRKEYRFAEVVPISAIKGQNTEELLNVIQKYLPEGPQYFPEDMVTDQPERQIVSEIIREKALHLLQDEIPHGIAVEIMSMKKRTDKNLVDVEATIYCEKESHKGIVIGKQGNMLKKIGSRARTDVERLLGSPIYLQLWVKVKKDWRDSDFLLKNFGYDSRNI